MMLDALELHPWQSSIAGELGAVLPCADAGAPRSSRKARRAPRLPRAPRAPSRASEAPGSLGKTAICVTPPRPGGGAERGGAFSPTGEDARNYAAIRPLRDRIARMRWTAAQVCPHHPTKVQECGAPTPSRIACCGWARAESSPAIVRGDAGASVRGVQHCGSVWECAACSSESRAERAREIQTAVAWHEDQGGEAMIGALTIRHRHYHDLRRMRRDMCRAFSSVVRGAPWARMRERYGIHYVRALEATHGANGWHPHFHVILTFDRAFAEHVDAETGEVTSPERARFVAWFRARWNAAVARCMGSEHVGEAPFDVEIEPIVQGEAASKYLSKMGLEMTDAFSGKSGSPWALLGAIEAAIATGEDDAAARKAWKQWTVGMHGARFLTWSRGMRERCGLREDASDEDLAHLAELDASPCIAIIPPHRSRRILGAPWIRTAILGCVEHGGGVPEIVAIVARYCGPEIASEVRAASSPRMRRAWEERRETRIAMMRAPPLEPRVLAPPVELEARGALRAHHGMRRTARASAEGWSVVDPARVELMLARLER